MSGVIDFSRWNTMPWWYLAGYKTREAAWEDFGRTQRDFCYPEAFIPKPQIEGSK